jgi:hypothetical protein
LTQGEIDSLAPNASTTLGQVVDVSGTFDVPATGPPQPRILNPTITVKASTVARAPTAVTAASLAPSLQPNMAYVQVYVRVTGSNPHITDLMPPELSNPCPGSFPDGGAIPGTAGVQATANGSDVFDISLNVPNVTYCVTQCGGPPCAPEMMVNDPLTVAQGILEVFDNGGAQPAQLIIPADNADLGH